MKNNQIVEEDEMTNEPQLPNFIPALIITIVSIFIIFCLWVGWQVTIGFSHPHETPEKISDFELQKIYQEDFNYNMHQFKDKYILNNMGTLKSKDGITFPYYCARTKDQTNVKGAIIMCHYKNGNARSLFGPMEIFLNMGWDCYSFDMRGSYHNDSNIQTYGFLDTQDLDAVIKEVKKQGYKHIGVWGTDAGGQTVGIYSALADAEKLDFYIMDCPIVDPFSRTEDIMKSNYGFGKSFREFATQMGSFMANMRFGFRFTDANLIEQCKKTDVPRLFIACDNDNVVPLERVKAAYKAAEGKQKFFYSFTNSDHMMGAYDEPENYRKIIEKFMKIVYHPKASKTKSPKNHMPDLNALFIHSF